MKVRHKEILCWYCYYKAYEDRIRDFKSTNKIDDQSARTLVYSEIKSLLPDITDVNLRKITSRAKKVYVLFEGIGIDKIQAVTYSASAISSLIEIQIQGIISCFPKTYKSSTDDTDECQKMISVTNRHAHVTESSEILDQYPNLYRECSSENFDYYGITDETSCGVSRETICPLCKLGHNDEEIEDWHAKLSGLPSVLTDKIRFKFYKRYKKETGCEPWQLSEDRLLINSKPENKVSYLTSPEQCEEKGPITFEARPDPKLIINRGAHHVLFAMENMGIMDYMAHA
ncbi:hypothetical protein GLOIN_2v544741 [Rhizophagus irregularis DAOM 181602=DAOM 197198]|uniref:Uncharacterized protein n=1 Tax=Rhizophagus irregularis (strain DAOM 181602 / DAOM 197198 / MUCL 43194) TaxID=747089 RepID=A0A2P4PE04_RHIID|nr:hypothetical protein GLOIN_2v544741 [Rhizophagus irregularis DAOM 181602=DAOM 197198]POG63592.1 hypothetical protein GLOIN_2v544741 [Rhizophagus irregularis DAOM 181602=DAOM 197198]|eukprot:XP_025170458.1 hypothetical protein GLOIN_2v544741 [Rhizophagus irregularis DAOM 181602=DAOM 197198]